jgi:hypothetical protein
VLQKIEMSAEDSQIMDSLKSYVNYVSDTAQSLMDSGNLKSAEKLLKNSEKSLRNKIPSDYSYRFGFLFTLNNNLA